MLIKFCKHGTGNARKAYTYLVQKKGWTGKDRKEVRVIRGDPQLVAEQAEALKFVHRYTSAVIAWSPEDNPSAAEIEKVVDDFEKTAFSGLSPERYQWSAILHRDDRGGVHVHVFAARVDLMTGKSLNIAPPGWQKTFDELCRYYNYSKGWARPDDPARARTLSPDYSAFIKAGMLRQGLVFEPQPRELINAYIEQKVILGLIQNRADVLHALKVAGFEIPRAGKDYITVKDPESEIKFRLKGALYDQAFNVQSYKKSERSGNNRTRADRGIDVQQAERAFSKLEEKRRKRAEHNTRVYGGNQEQAWKSDQANSGDGQSIGSDAQKTGKSEDQVMDKAHFGRTVSVPRNFYRKLGLEYVHGQGHSHENSILAESQAGNQHPGKDPGPADFKGLGCKAAPVTQWKIFDITEGHGSGKYLESGRKSCIEAIRKLGGKDDGIRDQVKRNIDQSFQAIRAGSKAVSRASRGLATAVGQLVQASENIRKQENRLDGIKAVMDKELEEFKARNLVEIAEGYGYEIDKERSTRSAISMRSGEHKIVVGQAEDGHGIYFTVDGQQEQGSVIDFVQNRLADSGQPSNLGYVRKKLRNNNFSFSCRPSVSDTPTIRPEKSSKDRVKVEAEIKSWDAIASHPYLEDRGLDRVLSDPRFENCIKMDSLGNVCFSHSDWQGFCGAEIKNYNFTGQIKHGTKGLWLSRFYKNDERLVICESGSDCLSYHLLHGDSRTRYASFGGTLSDRQKNLLQGLMRKAHDNGQDIVIAVDQDSQGDKYEQELRSLAPVNARMNRHIPISKDFNDDLRNRLDRVDSTDWEHGFELNV